MTAPLLALCLDEITAVERGYAEVLAGVLGVDEVPGASHFFDDLDADSMVMARFCARVRKRADLPTVSMKDIYRFSTITSLAAGLGRPAVDRSKPARLPDRPQPDPGIEPGAEPPSGSTPRYLLCGALQALIALAYAYLTVTVLDRGFTWLNQAVDLSTLYVRAVEFGCAALLGMCLLPVAAKWLLLGRWTPRTFQVWSLTYVRFWCVKTLLRANPIVLLAGSPTYSLYLRLLGAKIGKRVTVYSPTTVCTDLLTIGDDTVVRKDARLPGYRAVAGVIEIGPIAIGDDVIVGEQTVIDINTSIADGARLGHSCSLHAGQHIPAGEFWQGSPARAGTATYPNVPPVRCGSIRRFLYSLWQLVIPLGLYAPLLLGAPVLLARIPRLAPLLGSGPAMLTDWAYYRDIAMVTSVAAIGFGVLNLLFILTVPRLLNRGLEPDRVYPLFGFRYWLHRTITRRTNSAFFMELVGDSSYVVHYLRAVGYDLGRYEQTGSNFGASVKHDNPYLSSIGSGTMVADGLSMINADVSSTSFRLSRVAVGERSFLGNAIAYPAQAKVGQNCLLGTMTMVPIDGPMRADTGLLGAPSFVIPRTVERDSRLEVSEADERRRLLRAKNRHNTVTIVLFLLARWVPAFTAVLVGETTDLNASLGAPALLALSTASTGAGVLFLILLQRSVNGLQALRPDGCSIYDRVFWRHERYWKIPAQTWMQAFDGTPFKNLIWRALGVHIGRRVFDDGFTMPEKSLVTIGDDCTLNAGSVVQCHSQEDGAFKSARTTLGTGATLGVGSFVHYGVTIGEGVVLAPGTFVMKGEELPRQTRWIGNPAALAISTGSAYPPAPAALPADSAAVTAALATRPLAVVEWNGERWSFPELDSYPEPVEGPVTRLRIDRPGVLRLTGSGDGLRIELIPDDRELTRPTQIAPPPAYEGLALVGPDSTSRSPRGRGIATRYAAALLLIAGTGGAVTLLDVTHTLPAAAALQDLTCGWSSAGCGSHPATQLARGDAPDSAPDDTATGATTPDTAPPEHQTAPVVHRHAPVIRRLVPTIHRAAPAPSRSGGTPDGTASAVGTEPYNTEPYNTEPYNTEPYSDTGGDGTTSYYPTGKKKPKKSSSKTSSGAE